MLLFIFLIWLPAISSAWEADLPLITLPRVPAKLGSTVELRCSKVVLDGARNDPCYPHKGKDCEFRWSFNDKIKSRVSINRFMSSGFCATTSGTEEIANELSLKYGPGYTYKSSYYSKRPGNATLYCDNSVLTISNVKSYDFRTYSCNYIDWSFSTDGKFISQHTTLYNEAIDDFSSNEAFVYFGLSTIYNEPSTLIAQCMVSGGPVTWMARIVNDDCPVNRTNIFPTTYLPSCESETWLDLADLASQDDYLCFKYSVKSTNHTAFETSLIVFEDISCIEKSGVVFYCLTDNFSVGDEYGGVVLSRYYGWNMHRWHGLCVYTAPYVGIPILILVLLISAIVFAAIRGRCCSRGRRQPLFTPLVQVPQQVVQIDPTGPPAYHS